ncbi:hypothetical protein J4G37_52905, partial [Microvirga sp. 3-52]|nr:hypothetical protein [Microvirga sp. 3-52]
ENLMKLFEVRAYSITLGDVLSEQQQHILQQKFPQYEYTTDTMQSILQIHLTKSDEIYDLFDVLKMENTPVESIDRNTINFEQIFMKIVKGEKEYVLG